MPTTKTEQAEVKAKAEELATEQAEVKAKVTAKAVSKKNDTSEFEVADPEVFKPKELPLVIKPKSGKWKNDAQAEYAKTLNGYAYKNQEKWKIKKDVLLARLKELGDNPDKLSYYRGGEISEKLSYDNKAVKNILN